MAITISGINDLQKTLSALADQLMKKEHIFLQNNEEKDQAKKRLKNPDTLPQKNTKKPEDPSKHYRPIYNAQVALDGFSEKLKDKEVANWVEDKDTETYLATVVLPALKHVIYQTEADKKDRKILKIVTDKKNNPLERTSDKGIAVIKTQLMKSVTDFFLECSAVLTQYNTSHTPIATQPDATVSVTANGNGNGPSENKDLDNTPEPSFAVHAENGHGDPTALVPPASPTSINYTATIETAVNEAVSKARQEAEAAYQIKLADAIKAAEDKANKAHKLELTTMQAQLQNSSAKAIEQAKATLNTQHQAALTAAVEAAKSEAANQYSLDLLEAESRVKNDIEAQYQLALTAAIAKAKAEVATDDMKKTNGDFESLKTDHALLKANYSKAQADVNEAKLNFGRILSGANAALQQSTPEDQKFIPETDANTAVDRLATAVSDLAAQNAKLVEDHKKDIERIQGEHKLVVENLTKEKDNAITRLQTMVDLAKDFFRKIGQNISNWTFADTLHKTVISGTTIGAGLILGLGVVLSGNPFTAPIGFALFGVGLAGLLYTAYKTLTASSGNSAAQAAQRLKDVTTQTSNDLSSTASFGRKMSITAGSHKDLESKKVDSKVASNSKEFSIKKDSTIKIEVENSVHSINRRPSK